MRYIIYYRALKILGLLHRTFSKDNSVQAKKLLYISTVRSQLQYCSPVWRPNLIRYIVQLGKIQRRATKYILMDFNSDYKSRLISLNLLPKMTFGGVKMCDVSRLLTGHLLRARGRQVTLWGGGGEGGEGGEGGGGEGGKT